MTAHTDNMIAEDLNCSACGRRLMRGDTIAPLIASGAVSVNCVCGHTEPLIAPAPSGSDELAETLAIIDAALAEACDAWDAVKVLRGHGAEKLAAYNALHNVICKAISADLASVVRIPYPHYAISRVSARNRGLMLDAVTALRGWLDRADRAENLRHHQGIVASVVDNGAGYLAALVENRARVRGALSPDPAHAAA